MTQASPGPGPGPGPSLRRGVRNPLSATILEDEEACDPARHRHRVSINKYVLIYTHSSLLRLWLIRLFPFISPAGKHRYSYIIHYNSVFLGDSASSGSVLPEHCPVPFRLHFPSAPGPVTLPSTSKRAAPSRSAVSCFYAEIQDLNH
ncbi:Poly [ADP-ribose] polymerase 1 [Frankliniella fusca]|uniref:Poly [ADP-ribose] polymerase 1 n=1 Tax=Frankliniella fusca TaxID=407009 RepID=A0AAE1HSR1_9NEOP|nr:Poly [ADP-ribose] polymerase 1 [Frankliniella fusca]